MLLKNNKLYLLLSIFVILSFVLAACGGAETPAAEEPAAEEPAAEEPAAEEPAAEEPANPGLQMDAAEVATQFWSDEEYEESIAFMDADPINPEAPVYLQSLLDNKVDTSQYKMDPPYDICFSNAGVNLSLIHI